MTLFYLISIIDRGTFYMDNGHSFDSILFYGNEQLLFQFECLLFICIMIISGNFLFAILFLGVFTQVKPKNLSNYYCTIRKISFQLQILKHMMRLFVKKNLSNQTLIDERFLL